MPYKTESLQLNSQIIIDNNNCFRRWTLKYSSIQRSLDHGKGAVILNAG